MIEAIAAIALQSALQRDAPQLIQQAADHVFESTERLAFMIGKCSAVLPTGGSLPSVLGVGEPLAELGSREINDGVAEIAAIAYAEGLSEADDKALTIRGCAADINDAAAEARVHADGILSLAETIERDARD